MQVKAAFAIALAGVCLVAGIVALVVFVLIDDSSKPPATLGRTTPVAVATPPGSSMGMRAPAMPRVDPELDANPALAGRYVPPHPGADGVRGSFDDRAHLPPGTSLPVCSADQIAAQRISACYHSNPPTSGPHDNAPAPWGILATPATKESLVHNMEHGGVVVWYNTADTTALTALRNAVTTARNQGRLVVMSQYDGMEPETIALTGWTRLDKFSVGELTARRVSDFIAQHERRFNPEGF